MHEIGHSFLGHRQPSVIAEADFFARIAVPHRGLVSPGIPERYVLNLPDLGFLCRTCHERLCPMMSHNGASMASRWRNWRAESSVCKSLRSYRRKCRRRKPRNGGIIPRGQVSSACPKTFRREGGLLYGYKQCDPPTCKDVFTHDLWRMSDATDHWDFLIRRRTRQFSLFESGKHSRLRPMDPSLRKRLCPR